MKGRVNPSVPAAAYAVKQNRQNATQMEVSSLTDARLSVGGNIAGDRTYRT